MGVSIMALSYEILTNERVKFFDGTEKDVKRWAGRFYKEKQAVDRLEWIVGLGDNDITGYAILVLDGGKFQHVLKSKNLEIKTEELPRKMLHFVK